MTLDMVFVPKDRLFMNDRFVTVIRTALFLAYVSPIL
jgi:hypothetical protein